MIGDLGLAAVMLQPFRDFEGMREARNDAAGKQGGSHAARSSDAPAEFRLRRRRGHRRRASDRPESRLDSIIKQGFIRVGTTGDYKPFTYLNPETKRFEGIDIDMARSLAKALGVEARFVPTAWPKLMADFEADKFDIAMGGISVNLDRQKKGLFSIAYLVDGKTPIARCADKRRSTKRWRR